MNTENKVPENITEIYKVEEENQNYNNLTLKAIYMDDNFVYMQIDKTTVAQTRSGFLNMLTVLEESKEEIIDNIAKSVTKGSLN